MDSTGTCNSTNTEILISSDLVQGTGAQQHTYWAVQSRKFSSTLLLVLSKFLPMMHQCDQQSDS